MTTHPITTRGYGPIALMQGAGHIHVTFRDPPTRSAWYPGTRREIRYTAPLRGASMIAEVLRLGEEGFRVIGTPVEET